MATIHLASPTKETNVVIDTSGLPVTDRQRPAKKFVYVTYPQSWRYDLEFGFLPVLKRIIAMPGVNGVGRDGSLTKVLSSVANNGGTYIDPKDYRLGKYQDYVQYYPTSNGGKWYVDFCQKATVLPTGQIVWNNSEIKTPMMEFRAHIRDAGIVEPLIHEFYVQMIEGEKSKLNRLYGRLDRNPSIKVKVEESEARIKGMEKHWAAMGSQLLADIQATAPKKSKGLSKGVANV
tara:strand:+ start:29 stop:727 length:699 start_codon:yes stop_codon:yes gene_type:complete